MISRMAFILVLAAGMLMSLSGTALAVTGIAGSGSAGVAQYSDAGGRGGGTPDPSGDEGGVAPGSADQGEVLGSPDAGGNAHKASQVTVAQGGGGTGTRLPFTGFLAIPLLAAGVGLLLTGRILRRRLPSPAAI